MTDTELLNWIEEMEAQVWCNRKGSWTVFLRKGKVIIQPTKATLREAIIVAFEEVKSIQ